MRKIRLILLLTILSTFTALLATDTRSEAATGIRWGYYVGYDKPASFASLQAHINDLNYVSTYYGFGVNKDGSITGSDDSQVTSFVLGHNRKLLPLIQNNARYDYFHLFITNYTARNELINALLSLTQKYGYSGVNIDFEGLNPSDRPYLTGFMRDLYAKLNPAGKLVTMAVPAKTYDKRNGWSGAYDYAKLAPNMDLALIMAYDFHSKNTAPGAVAPISWVRDCTRFAASQFGKHKLILGAPAYGYDWNTTTNQASDVTSTRFSTILSVSRSSGARFSYDTTSASGVLNYRINGQSHSIWYDNARSFAAKLAVAETYDIAGVGLWRLGQEDPYLWRVMEGHTLDWASRIVDNTTPVRFSASSNWQRSTWNSQCYGSDYRYTSPKPRSYDYASYKVSLPIDGIFEVYGWWPSASGYNPTAPVRLYTYAGLRKFTVNQTAGGGRWVYLGTFSMARGDKWRMQFSRWTSAKGLVIADAVRFRPQ